MKDYERQDDSFGRRLIASLLTAVLLEAGGFVYYYGVLVDRVDNIERDVVELQSLSKTIVSMDRTLYLLDNKTDYLTVRLDKVTKLIEDIKATQDKSSTIIDSAAEHIKSRDLHKVK